MTEGRSKIVDRLAEEKGEWVRDYLRPRGVEVELRNHDNIHTVQDLIDVLSQVEDRDRSVVLAGQGSGPLRILNHKDRRGMVILWDVEELAQAEDRAGYRFGIIR